MNDAVKSAVRVLDLLELFSAASEPIGVSEASRLTGIPKSSAQALLTTLAAREYLDKTAAGYEMSALQKRNGWGGGPIARLRRASSPIMKRLAESTSQSAFLGVLTPDFQLRYIAKSISPADMRYDPPLTSTRPAYCMSAGLALLAWLPEGELDRFFRSVRLAPITSTTPTDAKQLRPLLVKIRKQRYAELLDARVPGLSGVSTVIVDGDEPLAALTLAGPTARFTEARRTLRVQVVEAAQEIGLRIASPSRRRLQEA